MKTQPQIKLLVEYIKILRDALIPLSNAHSPQERECLTDKDAATAQAALDKTEFVNKKRQKSL